MYLVFLAMFVVVSVLDSSCNSQGLSLGQELCVVFLGKTIYFHSASLHPSVHVGADKFYAGGWPCDGLAIPSMGK